MPMTSVHADKTLQINFDIRVCMATVESVSNLHIYGLHVPALLEFKLDVQSLTKKL